MVRFPRDIRLKSESGGGMKFGPNSTPHSPPTLNLCCVKMQTSLLLTRQPLAVDVATDCGANRSRCMALDVELHIYLQLSGS